MSVQTSSARDTSVGSSMHHAGLSRYIVIGGVAFLLFVAAFGPLVAPYDPFHNDLTVTYQPPSSDHWFGTDALGRDQLSRLVLGTRTSLMTAFVAVAIGLVIGGPLGVVAGFRRGWIDALLSRVIDGMLAVPALMLALTVIAVLGPGLRNATIVIGILIVPWFFRVARAATLDVSQETYIDASISVGCSKWRLLLRHVVPNIASPLLVQVSLSLGLAVIIEASLSFLGLGVRPPDPSWGGMLQEAAQRLDIGYLIWPPGLALVFTIGIFTLLSDAVRDSLGASGGRASGA